MEQNYVTSGFNETLIREIPGVSKQYDIANIDAILGDNSLNSSKVLNLDYAKITNVEVQNGQIVSLSISKLLAGELGVEADIGGGNVVIDGPNERILVHDGVTNRVVIGKLS